MAKKLQDEIKQTRPFASLEEEALLNLQRTADRLQRGFQQMLKPTGLTATQYNAMRILRGAGDAGLKCSELGDRLVSHDPDITRLLGRLEKLKLIRRHRDSKDRRVVYAHITPAGLEQLRLMDPIVAEAVSRTLRHMAPERLEMLVDLLEEAREKYE